MSGNFQFVSDYVDKTKAPDEQKYFDKIKSKKNVLRF
jgi:hypothetical protein